jgi:hypothetical protein
MPQMFNPFDYPFLVLVVCLLMFGISAWIGGRLRAGKPDMNEYTHSDFAFILSGTLTLLGLIVGFTFSMAVSRYDQRKDYEEGEANAIGTEFVRADLLPPDDATKVRALLKSYLDQRILHYKARNKERVRQIDIETARLQRELWSAVTPSASANPTIVAALAVSGMNDVLNSQGYTQASWWNRIPIAAWILLIWIAVFCNLLIGYTAHGRSVLLFLILPIALSISLFLIADIDSTRSGVIHVYPQNLESLAESLRSQ